jgi:hypothetical protein
LCCDCRDVWLFKDASTSWRDMTSGSMYWSLQASTVCRKMVKPAIQRPEHSYILVYGCVHDPYEYLSVVDVLFMIISATISLAIAFITFPNGMRSFSGYD